MFAKVLAGAMKASLHCGHGRVQSLGNLRVAASLLHEGQQGAILRSKLGEGVTKRVQFLGIDRPRRLRDVFMLLAKREKYSAQLLPSELVDAGISGQPEQPGLKLRGRLQPVDCPHHFDEDLLREIFDIIAPVGHGKNEARNAMLVGDDELPLGVFIALLSSANKVGQRGRGG